MVFVADFDSRDTTYRSNWRAAHVFVVYAEDSEGEGAYYTVRGNTVQELEAAGCSGLRPSTPAEAPATLGEKYERSGRQRRGRSRSRGS